MRAKIKPPLEVVVVDLKELGDIAWCLAEAATALDIPLEQVFQSNIDKLKKRYPEGFEVKRSLGRLRGDL